MRFSTLFSLVLSLSVSVVFGQPPNDIQTSFEFQEDDGRFILGQCPGCAVFTNGIARTVPDPQMVISGTNAWVVPPDSTGIIVFEVPARNLTLFFKDTTADARSVLTIRDPNGTALQTVNGSTAGSDTNGFTKVELTGSTIKTITLRNNAPAANPGDHVVMDDLTVSFNQTPALIIDDVFHFARFADGTFDNGEANNTFLTEALLTNTGNFAEVKLSAFDDQGQPLSITLEDQATQNRTTDSSFTYELQPGASVALTTVGLGDRTTSRKLVSGYWTVEVRRLEGQQPAQGGKVDGVAVFSRLQGDDANPVILFQTAVPPAHSLKQFTLFLDSSGNRDTGLALVNPTASTASQVSLTVWDQRLEQKIASATFDLAPGKAVSKFVWEYIRDFGTNVPAELLETLQETRGQVQVTGGTAVAPMALRQINPSGTFPQSVPALTAFPVVAGPASQ